MDVSSHPVCSVSRPGLQKWHELEFKFCLLILPYMCPLLHMGYSYSFPSWLALATALKQKFVFLLLRN